MPVAPVAQTLAALKLPPTVTVAAVPAPVPVPAPTPLNLAPDPVAQPSAPLSLREQLQAAARLRRATAQGLNQGALEHAMHKPMPIRPKAHIIAVVSAKGGVGRTTFAAALAKLLERPQGRVLALDLDPQNSLGAQLGLPRSAPGLSQASQGDETWSSHCQALPASPVECLPFGHADAAHVRSLEQHLANEPAWLMQQLASLALSSDDVLIIDLPSGASPWLAPTLAMADQVVAVTLPDPASYRVLDELQAWLAPLHQRTPAPRCSYLINQVDPTRALNLDMCQVLRQRIGRELLGMVRLDYSLDEAQAFEFDPFAQVPGSPACQDLRAAVHAVAATLAHHRQESSAS
ncbi:cellulose biosynthesis protein BcsQ [Pseudomonas aegrilactucae]|uniref:Cellulose synthase operon protein YhjQ n=1 Tax=Pseudomonas aegrilactucae TaxID=2854028 RepID=A0A9Q3AEU9_9PSED|nr:cellulose synthase operon protein YhjQ [Pseudomonas aegrilactucae]